MNRHPPRGQSIFISLMVSSIQAQGRSFECLHP
uniref:Uncharacterized protein n=1 Tax=Rhizophora mucronata TaxID=61149 RepID=A0A2P2N4E3_RHIMU